MKQPGEFVGDIGHAARPRLKQRRQPLDRAIGDVEARHHERAHVLRLGRLDRRRLPGVDRGGNVVLPFLERRLGALDARLVRQIGARCSPVAGCAPRPTARA